MNSSYKKSLLKLVGPVLGSDMAGFSAYSRSKGEACTLPPGAKFFIKELSPKAFMLIAISPGQGEERSYTPFVGWSFVLPIPAWDYYAMFREMGGRVWPASKYVSGFEQLGILEGARGYWGEELPITNDKDEIDECVSRSLQAVCRRIEAILPKFEAAVLEASAHIAK